MSHYTVGYLDDTRHRQEVCVTAEDSFEARMIAVEDVEYIHNHPHSVYSIFKEGNDFSSVL